MIIKIGNTHSTIAIERSDYSANPQFNLKQGLRELLSVYAENYKHSTAYSTFKYKCIECAHELETSGPYSRCINCGSQHITKGKRKWDGRIAFISWQMKFLTGFLPTVVEFLNENNYTVELVDERENAFEPPAEFVKSLPTWDIRPFMLESLSKILYNHEELYFPRGIYKAATNAGKNSFIAALQLTLNTKSLLLVHRKELFTQAYEFLTECGIEVSRYGGGHKELGHFTLAMVRTLKNGLSTIEVKQHLKGVSTLFVDECHRASAKEYRTVIDSTNAYARFFVSGTPLSSSNDVSNMEIIGRSGTVFDEVVNDFLIEKGYSQKVVVEVESYPNYLMGDESYEQQKLDSTSNLDKISKIREICARDNDEQILIIVEELSHMRLLYESLAGISKTVDFVHGSDDSRAEKLEKFNSKSINVLISTMIIKEGVNIHSINRGINAFGGKSTITLLQTIGRVLRSDGENDVCYWTEFEDHGRNTNKHFKERIKILENENFQIIYKKVTQ